MNQIQRYGPKMGNTSFWDQVFNAYGAFSDNNNNNNNINNNYFYDPITNKKQFKARNYKQQRKQQCTCTKL